VAIPEAARRVFPDHATRRSGGNQKATRNRANFLFVCRTIEPRKDLPTLVRAFEEVAASSRLRIRVGDWRANVDGWLMIC